MSTRVLVIGLDGATWDLLEPWARAGRLPVLAGLMERGTWGALRSTIPAITLPSWASFATGKNPGGHGLFAFERLAPDRYGTAGLANATDLRATRVWDVAAAVGRRVGVVNLPPAYPLRGIPNGFVVGCMLTPPGEPLVTPPDLADALGEYVVDTPAPKYLHRDDPDFETRALAYLGGLESQTRLRTDATLRLTQRHPTDVLCVVYYAPDRVQHYFWELLDPARVAEATGPVADAAVAVFRELDRSIGRLVDAAGADATVMLASDHGFRAKPRRAVRVNRWLADEGLLRQRPLWTVRRRLVRHVVPQRWRAQLDTVDRILVDRDRSQAWSDALFTSTAGVWIHAEGRYPRGSVALGAPYDAVRDRIVRGLEALKGPEGQPVFERVWRREELYRGPFVDEAPDVVAACTPDFGVVFESLRRDLRDRSLFGPFEELGYTGTHDLDGIYLFAGAGVQARGRAETHPIEAIAPTILQLLDVPVPSDMESPPCAAAFDPAFLAMHPLQRGEATGIMEGERGWSSEEQEERIAEHLRALGYLE